MSGGMTTTGKTNRKKSPLPLADAVLAAVTGGIIIYSRTLEPTRGETSWDWEVLTTVPGGF